MKCFFEVCADAAKHATETKSFGSHYSDVNNQNHEMHMHDCCEIFLCLSGGNSFLIDNKVYDIKNGDLFIINHFEAHQVVPDKNAVFERYIMLVHPTFLYTNSHGDADLCSCFYSENKTARITPAPKDTAYLISLFEALRGERQYGDELYKKLKCTELLLEVSRLFAAYGSTAAEGVSHKTVQLAIDYINGYYSSPLSLESVAKNAFVSPNQLSRLFKKYCGTTVAKYIISKRITEAKKLLSEGKSVTDTAFICGFNDYANFIKAFKKAVGVPPGKYRKEQN